MRTNPLVQFSKTTMQPYYQEAGITIYHGDCREVLPSLTADLVLTDPAYGINADRDRNCQKNGWRDFGSTGWDKERTPPDLVAAAVAAGRHAIVWGGNYFTDCLPPSMGWLSWDKGQKDFSLADFELAWTNYWLASRRLTLPRGRVMNERVHPTQKPLALMVWCIEWADRSEKRQIETILDPFMGSGTTLRAAKDLGRQAIGIEIEERYCEIAANRLRQEVLNFESVA